MDGKGKQKIRYMLWVLTAVVMILVLFFCSMGYAARIHEAQLRELTVIYPEVEDALKDNFSFYQAQTIRLGLTVMALMLVLVLSFGGYLVYMEKRDQRKLVKALAHESELIYVQLESFHKGQFELNPALMENSVSGQWENVHEKLRELSYYFSDLKQRLADEENGTKRLITDISHQLKTPLASIKMCHELVKSSELSEDERRDFLTTETQEIMKMEELVDELVKLSRLESNMIQIKPEKNSLKQTLSEAVGQIFVKAHAKKIEICVHMEEDVETLHDRKWTVEAFSNILENAVKYSEPMTTIHIRVSCLPSSVLLEFEDEGIGIQEDELHKIFKRFYRGSRAKELVKEGAGVGLYLARSIIEQQSGTIIAKRKSEHGTIFKVMLPA